MDAVMAFRKRLVAMLRRTSNPLVRVSQLGLKDRKTCFSKVDNKCVLGRERGKELSKVNERSWNVYENKGPVFHGSGQSWNVVENKGSYVLIAGISLKTKHVIHKLEVVRKTRYLIPRGRRGHPGSGDCVHRAGG